MPLLPLPEAFVRTISGLHGAAWLEQLPNRIDRCAARWNLVVGPPFHLSYNYVAPAVMQAGGLESNVVLKIGMAGLALNREVVALQHFGGEGCVRLIHADPDEGALLIERLIPGEILDRAVNDDEAAAAIAADVMARLWRPEPPPLLPLHFFPTVADWCAVFSRHRGVFDGSSGPLPERLLAQAEALAADLLRTSPQALLLHGDLHHGNILSADRGAPFLAIDPQGVIGDPAFEPGAFLLNPTPVSRELLARRLSVFSEKLGLDRERIRGWGIVRALLSACWTIEDRGGDYSGAITVAERLASIS